MKSTVNQGGCSRPGTIRKWTFLAIATLGLEWPVFQSIALILSYYPWSPLGYEPCGLQGLGWLIIYPTFLINFLFRLILKHFYHLNWFYLMPPVCGAVLFLPMIMGRSESVSVAFAVIGVLYMAVAVFWDGVIGLRRRSS